MQPELNIGLFGHVDHGKTTLTKMLTGKWTDTHSEEIKRGITIKIGYADMEIRRCKKCGMYSNKKECPFCGSKTELKRKVSFVDAPGHESLMATAISASAVIDGALFIIAANEKCPQEQTKEHLMVLELLGVKNIVIVQTKVDVVSKERAIENYNEIKNFVKGTVAENAPIIPVSSTYNLNAHYVIEAIDKFIPTPKRDETKEPLAYIIRSFDINQPGKKVDEMVGGVLGGTIVQGVFRVGDEVEIAPGIKTESGYVRLSTKITSLKSGSEDLEEAKPGGLIAFGTLLDPSLTKSDLLAGRIMGLKGTLPNETSELRLKYSLLNRKDIENPLLKEGEPLLLNIHATPTSGVIVKLEKKRAIVRLKRPVIAVKGDKIAISRRIGQRWRLAGLGIVD